VHNAAKYPIQDVIVQRGMCSKGWMPHPTVNIGREEGCTTFTLHGRGNGGQHADAKAVAKAGADFSALEFKSFGEGERVEPCQG
jgi:hypothetical protein